MQRSVSFAFAALLLAAAGCSTRTDFADQGTARAFGIDTAPPAGLARIYVLPTLSKGMFTDLNGYADISLFPDGSDRGAEIGATAKSAFVAFDIAPGDYDMVARTSEPLSKAEGAMTFVAGHTYFYRPVFFRASSEAGPNWTGEGKSSLGFDVVDRTAALTQLASLSLSQTSPSGMAFLKKMDAARNAVPPGPAPTPAAPQIPAAVQAQTAVPPAQPQADAARDLPAAAAIPAPTRFSILEQKLKELQRLREENLITQEDYDAKRRDLLKDY